ncbi:acyl-CoA dehydrogenase family protein [Nocardia sp. NPDC004750]
MQLLPDEDDVDLVAEAVVSLLEKNAARDLSLWPELVAAGLVSIAIPERFGGAGKGLPEVATILRELATDAVRVPALETLGFGVLSLVATAPDALAQGILPAVAEGAIITAALHEPGAAFVTLSKAVAETDGNNIARITGHKISVPYIDLARWLLIPTDLGVAVVEADARGIIRSEHPDAIRGATPSVNFEGLEISIEHLLPAQAQDIHRLRVACGGSVADGLLKGLLAQTAEQVRIHRSTEWSSAKFKIAASEISDLRDISHNLHTNTLEVISVLARAEGNSDLNEQVDCSIVKLASLLTGDFPAAVLKCRNLAADTIGNISSTLHRYYSLADEVIHLINISSGRNRPPDPRKKRW